MTNPEFPCAQPAHDLLVQALEDIIKPFGYIERNMPEGCRLNGHAALQQISSREFYTRLAKEALAAYRAAAVPSPEGGSAGWPSGIDIADEIDALLPTSMGYSTRAAVEQWWRDLVARKLSKLAAPAPAEGDADPWQLLLNINTWACMLPTFEVIHEGGPAAAAENVILAIQKATAALDVQPKGMSVAWAPEGFKLFAANDGLIPLMDALERAHRNGYMPDAILSEYEGFDWRAEPPGTEAEPEPDCFVKCQASEAECHAYGCRVQRAADEAKAAWVWNPASATWEEVRAPGRWQQGALYAFGPRPEALAGQAPAPAHQAWVWNPAVTSWELVRAPGQWQQGALYAFGPTAPEPLAGPSCESAPQTNRPVYAQLVASNVAALKTLLRNMLDQEQYDSGVEAMLDQIAEGVDEAMGDAYAEGRQDQLDQDKEDFGAPAVAPGPLTGEHIDGIKQALLDTAKDPFDIDEADRIVERILTAFKPPVQDTGDA